jgi:hypothetical protein
MLPIRFDKDNSIEFLKTETLLSSMFDSAPTAAS